MNFFHHTLGGICEHRLTANSRNLQVNISLYLGEKVSFTLNFTNFTYFILHLSTVEVSDKGMMHSF